MLWKWRQQALGWWAIEPWRDWLLRWRASRLMDHSPILLGRTMTRIELGRFGEYVAAHWLSGRGRRVLYRNYRGQHRGEVDLVCRHGKILTFIEVKTRSSIARGRPADAVNRDKQRLIQRGAVDWLRRLGNPAIPIRFDIVEVVLTGGELPQLNVIENAFQLPDNSMVGRTEAADDLS